MGRRITNCFEAIEEIIDSLGMKVEKIEEDLRHYAFPVVVDKDICYRCRACKAACENQNITFDKKGVVKINEIACKGCGSCVAVCPSGALFQRFPRDEHIFASIESGREAELCPLLAVEFEEPRRSIRLVCSKYADPFIILRCFEADVDGVMVINCSSGHNDRRIAEKSVRVAKELIETLGLNPERIHLEWIHPSDAKFDKKVAEFVSCI